MPRFLSSPKFRRDKKYLHDNIEDYLDIITYHICGQRERDSVQFFVDIIFSLRYLSSFSKTLNAPLYLITKKINA